MQIKSTLEAASIQFKESEYNDNCIIFKLLGVNPINLVYMESRSSIFSIDRDLFYYIDQQKLNYSFLLRNKEKEEFYFLEYKDKKNWLSSSFERTDKDEIFFGKIVLQKKIKLSEISKKLK